MTKLFAKILSLTLALLMLAGCASTPVTVPSTVPSTEPSTVPATTPVTVPTTTPATVPQTVPVTVPVTEGPKVLRKVEHDGVTVATQYEMTGRPEDYNKAISASYEEWPEEYFFSENLIFKGICVGKPELWDTDGFLYSLVYEFEITEVYSNDQVTSKGKGDKIRVVFSFIHESGGFNIFPEEGKEYIVFGGFPWGIPGEWCDASSHPYRLIVETDSDYAYLTYEFTEAVKQAHHEIHQRPYIQYAVDKAWFEDHIRQKVKENYGEDVIRHGNIIQVVNPTEIYPWIQYEKPFNRDPQEGYETHDGLFKAAKAVFKATCVSEAEYWRGVGGTYTAYQFKINAAIGEGEHIGETYKIGFPDVGKSSLVNADVGKEYVIICDSNFKLQGENPYYTTFDTRVSCVLPIEDDTILLDACFKEMVALSESKEEDLEEYPVNIDKFWNAVEQMRLSSEK